MRILQILPELQSGGVERGTVDLARYLQQNGHQAVVVSAGGALVGDHDLIRRYGALLTRYSGQWALGAGELACWGPVDRVLGLAHLACGRHEQARALLTSALAAAEGQGAAPWVVRCQDGLQQIELMSATIDA